MPGVADDSGFGGTTMQYQVLLDPAKLYAYRIPVPQVMQRSRPTTPTPAADFTRRAASSIYVRGLGLVRNTGGHRQHRRGQQQRRSGPHQRHRRK